MPLELGGLTGVAGVTPIGVPTVANVEVQGDPEGLARCERTHLADQMRLHIVGGDDASRQRKGRPRGQ